MRPTVPQLLFQGRLATANIISETRSIPPRHCAPLLFAVRIAYCNFDHNEAEMSPWRERKLVAPP